MLEIKIVIEATELANAINNLASALSSKNEIIPNVVIPDSTPVTQKNIADEPKNIPTSKTVATVPLAQPPQYTVEQIMTAGAALMDAGKANELINLLHSFGVQAVMDLKSEQLGQFATAMRELGAQI